jgi:hypothetical protein
MKRRKPIRFVKFRVYCGPGQSGLFVYARVFESKRDMLLTLRVESRADGTETIAHNTGALTETYRIVRYSASGRRRMSACIGRVNFYQGRLGSGTVAHEFCHAMFAWAERKRLKHPGARDDKMIEEEMCYALGHMCQRFVARAVKLGLYRE